MLTVVGQDGSAGDGSSLIDEIVREGARRMLAAALEAEVDAYIAALAGELDERGHRLVVRKRPRRAAAGAHLGGCGGRTGAAGQRQARRRDQRRTATVLPRHP